MKTVALEDLVASTILTFCENAAELGCPRDKDVDMWFRELSEDDMRKVGEKLLDIQERDLKMSKGELCSGCGCEPHPNTRCEEAAALRDGEEIERDILMKEISIELDLDTIEGMLAFARSRIVNDRDALINYGVNLALKEIVESEGKCLDV